MFNTVLPFCRVQRNRNPTAGRESWRWVDIYKFFMHSPSSRRKYLVEIHAYDNHRYTADFYAKVNNVNRYRLRTNQQAAGKLGGGVVAGGHPGRSAAARPAGVLRLHRGGNGERNERRQYEAVSDVQAHAGAKSQPAALQRYYHS